MIVTTAQTATILAFWCSSVQFSGLCYLNNHLDGGQGGCQVLRVRGSDSDGHTASIQATVEGGDQVDSCTELFKSTISFAIFLKTCRKSVRDMSRYSCDSEEKSRQANVIYIAPNHNKVVSRYFKRNRRKKCLVAPPTWRVDESYMVSGVQASHQCCSHSLCPLVQLQTGSCTCHRALRSKR